MCARETWAAREGRAVGRVGCVVVAVAWRSCRAVSAVGGRASHSDFSGLTNPAGLNSLYFNAPVRPHGFDDMIKYRSILSSL